MGSFDAPRAFTRIDFKQLYDCQSLDEGHFGDTYCASLRIPGEPHLKVVCKVPKQANDDQREIQTLVSLEPHPLVVKLIGVCHDWDYESQTAMIFEYHPGGNLKTYVEAKYPNGSELDIDELCAFAYYMACSIRHLHSNGVLHRDIALRNFVLSREGVPVVIDFGLSRKVPEYSSLSKTAVPWKQMPPESIGGMRLSTQKSDVYSLGITFWQLFHQAKTPFPHVRSYIELLQILNAAGASRDASSGFDAPPHLPSAPLKFGSAVPLPMRELIEKMCAISMGDRPHAFEVCEALEQLLSPTVLRKAQAFVGVSSNEYNNVDDIFGHMPMSMSPPSRPLIANTHATRAIPETMHEHEIKSSEISPTPMRREDAYPVHKRHLTPESMKQASSLESSLYGGSSMASSSFASSSAAWTSFSSMSLEAPVERDEEMTSSELLQDPPRQNDGIAKDLEPSMSERGKGLHAELHGVGFEDKGAVVRTLRTNCFDRESLCDITDEQLRDMFPAHGTYNRMKQYITDRRKNYAPSLSIVSQDLFSQLQPLMFKNVHQVVTTLRENDLDINLLQRCTDQQLSGMFAAPGTFLKMQEFIELLRKEKKTRGRHRRSTVTVLSTLHYRARSLTGSMSALHLAARDGDLAVVENIIANGRVDLNATDEQGRTPLFFAASCGRRAVVHALMKQHGRVDASVCDTCGETPLMAALRNEHVDVALDLLQTPGASLHIDAIAVEDHETALGIASRNGNLRVVRLLLQRRVDASVQNSDGDTPLIAALRNEHVDVAREILYAPDVEIRIDAVSVDERTALSIASTEGLLQIVELLLQHKPAHKRIDSPPGAALSFALSNQHGKVALCLLQDARITSPLEGRDVYSSLQLALELELMLPEKAGLPMHKAAILRILQDNFNDKFSDADGNTGIHALVTMPERVGLVILHVLLVARHVAFELNRKNLRGETALMFALRERRYKFAKKLLLMENIDCSSKDEHTLNTVLHEAVMLPDEEIVDMILNVKLHPVNIDARNLLGETALQLTLTNEEASKHAMRLLEVKDVDLAVSAIVEDFPTALHLATKLKDRELSVSIINRLLYDFSHRLGANARDNLGRTPLMEAAREQNIPAMERLLSDPSVDSSLVDSEGNTLLHAAVFSPRDDPIRALDFLLEAPSTAVAVNAKNHKGDTALLFALQLRNNDTEFKMPKRLFDDERVDPNVTNNDGNNALHLAVMMNNRAAGAKLLRLLLSSDRLTDINAQNRNGDSPFLLSLKSMINYRGFTTPTWKLLLRDERVDINVVNTEGNTALHLAAMINDKRKREDAVAELTSMNDTRRKFGYYTENRAGRTPLDIQKDLFTQYD